MSAWTQRALACLAMLLTASVARADYWDATAMGRLEVAMLRAGHGELWGEVQQLISPYHNAHVMKDNRQDARYRLRTFGGSGPAFEGNELLKVSKGGDQGTTYVVSLVSQLGTRAHQATGRREIHGALEVFDAKFVPVSGALNLTVGRVGSDLPKVELQSRVLLRGLNGEPILQMRKQTFGDEGERALTTYGFHFGGNLGSTKMPQSGVFQRVAKALYGLADRRATKVADRAAYRATSRGGAAAPRADRR